MSPRQTYITFIFEDSVPETDQDRFLAQARTWAGVLKADRIDPKTRSTRYGRFAFASVAEKSAPEVLRHLREDPRVRDAEVPAPRGPAAPRKGS